MPLLPQNAPFDVKALYDAFQTDLHGALEIYEEIKEQIAYRNAEALFK